MCARYRTLNCHVFIVPHFSFHVKVNSDREVDSRRAPQSRQTYSAVVGVDVGSDPVFYHITMVYLFTFKLPLGT